MKRIFLVARQEFITYVTRRGFVISVFLMPVWILAAAIVPKWADRSVTPQAFTVIDQAGGYAQAIAQSASRPGSHFRYIPPEAPLSHTTPAVLHDRIAQMLSQKGGPAAVIVIPPDFGLAGRNAAEYWTSGTLKPDLKAFVEGILTDQLRTRSLQKAFPTASPALLHVSAQLKSFDPAGRGAGHEVSFFDVAQKYAPAVLAFLLVLIILMNSASLMSAVIEEKSNRIVEVLLSCINPRDFMLGKLLGAAAAAVLTMGIWISIVVLSILLLLPDGVGLIGSVLSTLATGWMSFALILCFACGLLIYASIFLAIGSMAKSVQDAQALLGPTMLLVMAPVLIMPALLKDPNGIVATTMTWIPIYTPFFMIFRLPWHPPPVEVAGAMLLMVATTIFLFVQMGRLFAAHVLSTERPPRLFSFLRRRVMGRARS